MKALPPGTILQHMYLKRRLKLLKTGFFIEVGAGSGDITSILVSSGWKGVVFEMDVDSALALSRRFKKEISAGVLTILNQDFTKYIQPELKADLVLSSMVMEHFTDEEQCEFLYKSSQMLNSNGLLLGLVPSSPKHWGIEDEIAGHYRRYSANSLSELLSNSQWELSHVTGLTYPLSNIVLPLSNYLVSRSESHKKSMSAIERTSLSGRRNVPLKTHFPLMFKLLLNPFTLSPFYLLQRVFKNSPFSLVIYFEACPVKGDKNV
ncbi:MAG: hypothetical protein CMF25_05750 [Kangiellaceae bacterium]|nr:hypothetical protein [Kangiellaceae bacterium]